MHSKISSLSLNGDYYIVFDRELENTFNTFKRRSKNFRLVFVKIVCPLIFRLDFLATARPYITYIWKQVQCGTVRAQILTHLT